MSEYYIAKGTGYIGPFDIGRLRSMGITPDTIIWRQGLPGWMPASQIPELVTMFGYAPQQPYQQPYQQPQYGHYQQSGSVQQRPPSPLGRAIGGMILFTPVGIPALVFAIRFLSSWSDCRYAEALQFRDRSLHFSRIAIRVGIIILIVLAAIYTTYFILIIAFLSQV